MTDLDNLVTVAVPGVHLMPALVGPRDANIRQIELAFPATRIDLRANDVQVSGDDAPQVALLIEELVVVLQSGQHLDPAMISRSIEMVRRDERPSEVLTDDIMRGAKGRAVRPKTAGQKRYIDAVRENVITFGLGPAGTGKSWLAVAMAIHALQSKQVQRIILTRPADTRPASFESRCLMNRRAASGSLASFTTAIG